MTDEEDKLDLYSIFTREEISAFKREVAMTKGGLQEATKLLQLPQTRLRAKFYPTTRRLYKLWTLLGYSHAIFLIVVPIILFIFTRWYWSLASMLFDIVILHYVHNSVNLELFTRIHFTDKLLLSEDEK